MAGDVVLSIDISKVGISKTSEILRSKEDVK